MTHVMLLIAEKTDMISHFVIKWQHVLAISMAAQALCVTMLHISTMGGTVFLIASNAKDEKTIYQIRMELAPQIKIALRDVLATNQIDPI